MNEKILININDVLSKNKNIILIPHSSPDADALGSCLALYHFFKNENNVNIISPNQYTDILNFLPGSESVLVFDNEKEKSTNLLKNADIISNSLLRPNAKIKRDSIDIKSKTSLVDDWLNITLFDSIDGNLSLAQISSKITSADNLSGTRN